MTMADVERQADSMPLGTPQEVTERIIAPADTPAPTGADQSQPRRAAARNVPGADPPLRARSAAGAAGS